MSLADQQCEPCRGGVPPMQRDQAELRLQDLDPAWRITDDGHILRDFELPDFKSALALASRIGDLAEEQGHHPLLYVTWGRCGVEFWTHKIDGLHEADFIMAAKVDRLWAKEAGSGASG